MGPPAEYARYSDEDLMAHLSRGDVGALEALSERHARPAYSLALRVVGDHGWAEELLQDVLLRLWRKPQMYDPSRGDVRRWLLSVTHHAAIDALRGRRGTARNRDAGPTPLAFLAWEGEDPAESAYKAWRAESVRQALAELPGAQREALELAYFSGLSQTEIAAHTGEALGTIKTRIRLGMTKLRQSLRQVGANE